MVKAHLPGGPGTVPVEACVELVRLTRTHPKVKRGSSVRAAIALAQILRAEKPGTFSEEHFFAVALSVLANRIELQTGKFSNRPYAELLNELMLELRALLKKKPTL